MTQPFPPSHDASAGAARADALLPLAPALYRTARRLTRRPEDASAVTLTAMAALHAGEGREPSRGAAFRALWRALEQRWRQQAYVPVEPSTEPAEQILVGRYNATDGSA